MNDDTPIPLEAPRRAAWPAVLAWVVIAACMGLVVFAEFRPRTPDPLVSEESGADLLIQARVAVGMHRLAGSNSPGGASFLASVDEVAGGSTVKRIRAAVVAAELQGRDAALERLSPLNSRPLVDPWRADVSLLTQIYRHGPSFLGPAEREQLLRRHGWFARLALSHGLPDDHPDRRAALAPARRAAVTAVALLALGSGAALIGAALLILAAVLRFTGRLRAAYVPPPPGVAGPFVEAFAVYMLGMIVVSAAIAFLLRTTHPPLHAQWWIAASVPLAVLWPRLRGLSGAQVRAGFGWTRGRGVIREAACGVIGYVAGVPLLIVAILVTSLLARASGATPSHPIIEEIAGGAGGIPRVLQVVQLYALVAIYAPLVEETFFRGALYHHVRRRLPWWLSALIVALIFAAIHPQGWVGIPMLATIALVLGALREWRESIIAPVVAHACVNAVTTTTMLLVTSG